MKNLYWQIGKVEVFQLTEMIDNKFFSSFIPKALPEEVLKIKWLLPYFADKKGKLKAQIQSFIVKSNGKNILVDTCSGNHKDRPGMPEWGNLNTNYLEKFKTLGFSPDDINYVICTHLHFDHVGWNTKLENGKWIPTFPNAKYLFSKKEYNYWIQKPEKEVQDDFNGIDDSVTPIVEAGLAELVDDNFTIDDSIRFIPTPGHTPHHISVVIESEGKKAIITGDVMHHPCQIANPDWTTQADTYPDQAIESRNKLLKEIKNTDTLIIGTHFSDPVAGFVNWNNGRYEFKVQPRGMKMKL